MSESSGRPELLGPATLPQLPDCVRKPAYDRSSLGIGMAHIGVGAFHRCQRGQYFQVPVHVDL